MTSALRFERSLRCEDCGRKRPDGERGWHGMLGREDDETVTVVIICPACHEREFDESSWET
jgi:hypothetical protein